MQNDHTELYHVINFKSKLKSLEQTIFTCIKFITI